MNIESWKYCSLYKSITELPSFEGESNNIVNLFEEFDFDVIICDDKVVIGSAEGLKIQKYDDLQISPEGIYEFYESPAVKLNLSQKARGIKIEVMENISANIKISYSLNSSDHYIRNSILIGKGARLNVVECFSSENKEALYLLNNVVSIKLLENAKCEHYFIQNHSKHVAHYYSAHICLNLHANYNASCINVGGMLVKSDIYVDLLGSYAKYFLKGVNLASGKQQHDAFFPVIHWHPECESSQDFRQVIQDQAIASFYGKVCVKEGAAQTVSRQMNKNLLCSALAKAYSRPELDIHNDDVVCSHGSATGGVRG